jgi:hypothetical protein
MAVSIHSTGAALRHVAETREKIQRWTHYVRMGVELDLLAIVVCVAVYFLARWLPEFGIPEAASEIVALVIMIPLLWACAWWIVNEFVNHSFTCPYCRKSLPIIHFWECGQCHQEMRLSCIMWTVFRSCVACHNAPQYLKCPHCDVPIPLVEAPDPDMMVNCARHIFDSALLAYPAEPDAAAPSIPDGFERKSVPPLVVAWRRAREDTLEIWWTHVGYPGFRVRGCRYAKVPTRPDEPDGQPVMAPSDALADRIDVGVSAGRHGNFGFWLERDGFEPAGFVGFGVPPGAAAPEATAPDPREERRKRNRAKLGEIELLHREWLEEEERLATQLGHGEISQTEYERRKEITGDLYENEINALTGPERIY